ncbi:hypothetical protein [Glycomyces sp. NPDC047010]|uniref:hypothetical protein n=1 Tax=Glycomyces sp. NPDC047010 TaxID=3155023 RepID=UPI0034060B64
MDRSASHDLGEGFLALPAFERSTGRWGTVYLADADGEPIALRRAPKGAPAALTATPLPDTDGIELPLKRELLGAGMVFTEPATASGGPVVGVRPPDGRATDWLFPSTVGRLLQRRVRLEVHEAAPAADASSQEVAPR